MRQRGGSWIGWCLAMGLVVSSACVGVYPTAANMRHLSVNVEPGNTETANRMNIYATFQGPYTVPLGRRFVLQTARISPVEPADVLLTVLLVQQGHSPKGAVRDYWLITASEPTQLRFDPGIVFDGGETLQINNLASNTTSVRVALYGFETRR